MNKSHSSEIIIKTNLETTEDIPQAKTSSLSIQKRIGAFMAITLIGILGSLTGMSISQVFVKSDLVAAISILLGGVISSIGSGLIVVMILQASLEWKSN